MFSGGIKRDQWFEMGYSRRLSLGTIYLVGKYFIIADNENSGKAE